MTREGALWMGDLADYMDEDFIVTCYRSLGEDQVQNVKVMKNRYTGQPAGYCFVNFTSDQVALSAMHRLNGKVVPNSQPPIRFKLNHNSTRGQVVEKEYSLWVGDLTPDVDDVALYKIFGTRYNSIKTAKVIYDNTGTSKGFAFVRFYNEDEYKDALAHMNGFSGLGQKTLKVSYAVPKKQFFAGAQGTQMGTTGDYNQYYDPYSWNNCNWQENWQSGGGGGYYGDPYSSYGDYSMGSDGVEGDNRDSSKDDFEPVEWNTPLDLQKLNKEYMERSEDLWQAMESARWSYWDSSSKQEDE